MQRRIFIKNLGLFSISTSVMPLTVDKSIVDLILSPAHENDLIKKYVLRESAINDYADSTAALAENSIRTMFWLTADPRGSLTTAQKRNALKSYEVTKEDLYTACNFKNNEVTDAVASAYEWTWAGGSLALGIVSPPSAAVAIGLFVLEKAATIPVNWSIQADKEAQYNLCARTVEKYYVAKSSAKKFMEEEEISNIIKIPFKEKTEVIVESLPQSSLVKTAASAVRQSTPNQQEVFSVLMQQQHLELQRQLQRFEQMMHDTNDVRSRQAAVELFEFQNKERQAGIYLTQQLLLYGFGDAELANKFFTLANSLNTIYSTYMQFGLGSGLTLAATANYVGAGIAIASLFQSSSGGNDGFKALFKSIRQLTEIVIKGFTEIQKTQIDILKRLQEISDLLIEQGTIEVSMLRSMQSEIEAFRADYDTDQYHEIERSLTDAHFRLNDLFKNEDFNITKEPYKTEYLKILGDFALYAKDHAATNRMLSGYSTTFTIQDVVNKFERMHTFEYMIGVVPVVHRTVESYIPGFTSSEFEKKIPNPYEWSRAFYLYYQSVFATGIENAVVKNHIKMFLEKGEMIKSFLSKYTKEEFIKSVSEQHKKLLVEFINELNTQFKSILATEPYYLYEFLLTTFSNSRYYDNSTLESFALTGDPISQNFIITNAGSLVNTKRVYGYSTISNLVQSFLLLKQLNEIEDYPMTSQTFPHPVINFQMSHAKLKFKNSPVTISFSYVPHTAGGGFQSSFVYGKDVQDLAEVKGGSRQADFSRVLENHNFSTKYWKVYPRGLYQSDQPEKNQIDFLDFLRNEIIHSEYRLRSKLIKKLIVRESEVMTKAASLVNQLDSLGYLLSSSLTFMKYKRDENFENSYLQRTIGIPNTLPPQKYSLGFSRDIFSKYVEFISKDLYNSYRPEEEDKEQFWKFKNNFNFKQHSVPSMDQLNFSDYQLTKYAVSNVHGELTGHMNKLYQITSDSKTISGTNYNIQRIINECTTYLQKMS